MGPQGEQGIPGSAFSSAYGVIYGSQNSVQVLENQNIPFDLSGDMLECVFVSGGIRVGIAGTYYVHFEANSKCEQTGSLEIAIDNIPNVRGYVQFATYAYPEVVCGGAVVTLAQNQLVTIKNTSGKSIRFNEPATPGLSFGSMSLFRIG
jgi:hypothetical protein